MSNTTLSATDMYLAGTLAVNEVNLAVYNSDAPLNTVHRSKVFGNTTFINTLKPGVHR